jgi:hypothetical protein
MLRKLGRHDAYHKTYNSMLGCWVKIENGEFTSNELEVGTPSCPAGQYDGQNCFIGTAPAGTQPFVHNGSLYYTPTVSCPMGSFDGANCFIATPPTKPFMWSGNLYYDDIGGSCPVAGSWFDGANCFMAPAGHEPFIYNGSMYVRPDNNVCSMPGSWFDGANCYVATPASGARAFTISQNLYTTPVWSCE